MKDDFLIRADDAVDVTPADVHAGSTCLQGVRAEGTSLLPDAVPAGHLAKASSAPPTPAPTPLRSHAETGRLLEIGRNSCLLVCAPVIKQSY